MPKPFQEGASKALQALHTPSHSNPDSPDMAKYPRSKSSMQGKLHFFVSSASKLNLDYASSSSFLSSKRGSQEIDSSDTLSKTIKDMTANFSYQLGKIDNDDEFLAVEQVN